MRRADGDRSAPPGWLATAAGMVAGAALAYGGWRILGLSGWLVPLYLTLAYRCAVPLAVEVYVLAFTAWGAAQPAGAGYRPGSGEGR